MTRHCCATARQILLPQIDIARPSSGSSIVGVLNVGWVGWVRRLHSILRPPVWGTLVLADHEPRST